jgi:hypothetical protein
MPSAIVPALEVASALDPADEFSLVPTDVHATRPSTAAAIAIDERFIVPPSPEHLQ